jgi:hypothetical protein
VPGADADGPEDADLPGPLADVAQGEEADPDGRAGEHEGHDDARKGLARVSQPGPGDLLGGDGRVVLDLGAVPRLGADGHLVLPHDDLHLVIEVAGDLLLHLRGGGLLAAALEGLDGVEPAGHPQQLLPDLQVDPDRGVLGGAAVGAAPVDHELPAQQGDLLAGLEGQVAGELMADDHLALGDGQEHRLLGAAVGQGHLAARADQDDPPLLLLPEDLLLDDRQEVADDHRARLRELSDVLLGHRRRGETLLPELGEVLLGREDQQVEAELLHVLSVVVLEDGEAGVGLGLLVVKELLRSDVVGAEQRELGHDDADGHQDRNDAEGEVQLAVGDFLSDESPNAHISFWPGACSPRRRGRPPPAPGIRRR